MAAPMSECMLAGNLLSYREMGNASPLRIMHAAAPGHAGGLESVLLELTEGLQGRGHAVFLAAVIDAGAEQHPVPRRAEQAGVEVGRITVSGRGYFTEYRAIRRMIRSFRPDVVHTHGYRSDLVAGAAARHERIPWISTVHGFTGGGPKNRLYEWLQRRASRRAQGVIAVSHPLRDRLERDGVPAERVRVIPNAWSPKPALDRAGARRTLGVSGNAPLLGWVGRLSGEKGADVFLDALALMPDLAWQASILGSGREEAQLRGRAQARGIADRITWLGLVPDAARVFPAFDVYVLSSRTEGTPIALFEAMASGVPIVATSVGGVPDVVSGAEATLVPSDDPASLAGALRATLSAPEAAAGRADRARARLAAQFASGPWLDAHERLYRVVISSHHR